MSEAVKEEAVYTIRKWELGDVFVLSTILRKIGFKEFKACFSGVDIKGMVDTVKDDADGDTLKKIGIEVGWKIGDVILGNLETCQSDIYRLLERLSGIKAKEIDKLPVKDALALFKALFKAEGFADFFSEAIESLTSGS